MSFRVCFSKRVYSATVVLFLLEIVFFASRLLTANPAVLPLTVIYYEGLARLCQFSVKYSSRRRNE